jgi:hypothetical protein
MAIHRTLIIGGEKIEVELAHLEYQSPLHDTPTFATRFAEREPTGQTKVILAGRTSSGEKIEGQYLLLDIPGKGTLELEPWTDTPTVGGKQ